MTMTMTSTPVRYGEHVRAKHGTPCLLCGANEHRPYTDHCHAHGWVRGPLCRRCNILMISVDRGTTPRDAALQPPLTCAALVKHAARCADCEPITALTHPVTDGKRFTMTLEPEDYERLRKLAYIHDRPVAVEARNLLLTEINRLTADEGEGER